eukprot:7384415-Prymnesium_polylepis.1
MAFMSAKPLTVGGVDCFVSRSGYTGEDGFEIAVPKGTGAEHQVLLRARGGRVGKRARALGEVGGDGVSAEAPLSHAARTNNNTRRARICAR